MAVGPLLLGFVVLALAVLGLFLFYTMVHRAFRRVGFTPGEASLILFGTLIGSAINVPLWPTPVGGGWILAANVGGAVVPVLVSAWLLRRIPSLALPALVAVTFVAFATYLVTGVTPEGIVVVGPLALVPPLVAAGVSLTSFWREEDHAAPLAYVGGTIGALVGADVFRLAEFLAQPAPGPGAVASVGGAAVFDMVFLTGIAAVGLDVLVFRRLRKERHHADLPYDEGEVFTVATPPERLRDWEYKGFGSKKPFTVHAEAVRERAEVVRERAERRYPETARAVRTEVLRQQPARPPSALSATEDDRLAGHRAWEEQMRRRRGG